MNLIKLSPFHNGLRFRGGDSFHNLWDEMNNLFDTFSSDLPTTFSNGRNFVPALDVREDEKSVIVQAELPGLEEKDIDISLKDGIFTLKGEKKSEQKTEKQNHVHIERSFGSFQRSFKLSSDIEVSKVDATFKNGVLTVVLPKTVNEKQEQKIKIKAN